MNIGWHDKTEQRSVKGTALIDKAFHLIDVVGASPGHVSVRTLMHETGWARPTLYRILSAITAKGYLRLDPVTQGYTLGYRFLDLAHNVWSGPDLAAVASSELRRLRNMTGETTYLAVLHNGAMMALGKFEGTHVVRSAASLGVRKPLHCTSQGKALLAFLSDAEVERLIGRHELERFTSNTIVQPAQLKLHLAVVRQKGYAIEDEEIILGNRCVGAPILDYAHKPVGVVSVAGPTWRLTSERAEQLGPEIALAARNIGAQIQGPREVSAAENGHPVAHPLSGSPAFYGGDPVWNRSRQAVVWTDRLGPAIFETGVASHRVYLLPRDAPIMAAAISGDIFEVWQSGQKVQLIDGELRTVCESDEAETLAATMHPDGSLWRAVRMTAGCQIEGGKISWSLSGQVDAMAWTPDGSSLFVADPHKGAIYRFHTAAKSPQVFTRIPRVSGEPRSIAVDPGGRLWVALYGGWSIARLSEDGEIEHVIALPVPRPTGLAFGGSDMRTIFITSARVGLSREVLNSAPLSGQLLVQRI